MVCKFLGEICFVCSVSSKFVCCSLAPPSMADPAMPAPAPAPAAPWVPPPAVHTWLRRVLEDDGVNLRIGVEGSHSPEVTLRLDKRDVEAYFFRHAYGCNGPETLRILAIVETTNGDVLSVGMETLAVAPFCRAFEGGLGKGHGRGF